MWARLFSMFALLALATCVAASEPRRVSGTIGNGGLLLIEAEVNAVPIQGIVDTGASHHAYDQKLIPILEGFEAAGNGAVIGVCAPQRVLIGPMGDTVNIGSAVVDLIPFRAKSQERFDAVIGIPFLVGRSIHIDPSQQRFTIQQPVIADVDGIRIWLDELKRPSVSLLIADQEVRALIDTGSNASVTASEEEFERILNHFAGANEQPATTSLSLGGETQRRKMTVPSVGIGNHVVRDVVIVESKVTKVGMAFLNRFKSVIDMLNLRLQLTTLPDAP
jgi:predicted aspartyl protease